MPGKKSSTLYARASESLSPNEKNSLAQFEKWLASTRKPSSGDPVDGRQLVENLRNESHLTGAGAFGDFHALKEFLADSGGTNQAAQREERVEHHRKTCDAHKLKGLPNPSGLPPQMLRYSTSQYAAALIVESVLGVVAKTEFDQGLLSPQDAFARIVTGWNSARFKHDQKLAKESPVWATFDRVPGTPRNDAKGMAEALGLPLPRPSRDTILLEFTYESAHVTNHRFPTVADAGLFHQFRPCAEISPDPDAPSTLCGWTHPTGPWPAQPEVVHDNALLSIVQRPPRFVGRIP